MGADYMSAEVTMPAGWDDTGRGEDARDVLMGRARAIPGERLLEIADQMCFYDFDPEAAADMPSAAVTLAKILDAINLIVDGGDRETSIFDGKAQTGGMSWGDPPTESFDLIAALAESRICDEPMPWYVGPTLGDLILEAVTTMDTTPPPSEGITRHYVVVGIDVRDLTARPNMTGAVEIALGIGLPACDIPFVAQLEASG